MTPLAILTRSVLRAPWLLQHSVFRVFNTLAVSFGQAKYCFQYFSG